MLQKELNVATLQCQNPSGSRAYEDQYRAFIGKFQSDLAANGRSMQQLAGRKRFNVDVVVTEFANRTAQRAPVDKEFCSRSKRAFDWALSTAGHLARPGAAAVRSRPRDEHLSLPVSVAGA